MELSRGHLVRKASGVTPDPKVRLATPSLSRPLMPVPPCCLGSSAASSRAVGTGLLSGSQPPCRPSAQAPSSPGLPSPAWPWLQTAHAQGQTRSSHPSGDPGPMGPPGRHGQRGPKGEKGEKGRAVCTPRRAGWACEGLEDPPDTSPALGTAGELTQHVLGFCCCLRCFFCCLFVCFPHVNASHNLPFTFLVPR